ncbi:PEPxxWA-CTERM sorting domain-containing protein [Sandarakinorhabdus sp. DWP1-3-1]|uniref:PEPxxWA-CTERM sorting domain-containing protein n=1 Tax=Sandarakinorhabdus sp. DWP1-3-1 TaxID=2804627 RepID=UPI003CE994BD
MVKLLLTSAIVAGALVAPAQAASYYLFDGDSSAAVEISGGTVVNSFSTFGLAYPVAINSTIWLGGRDNGGSTEYTLAGVATGNTAAGGPVISQLLDGATNGSVNYGVTCCSGQNVVTIANADWSNQQTLFNLSSNGSGIAYDSSTNSLFVSDFDGAVTNYALTGVALGSFTANIVAIAYDSASDSLFGWNGSSQSLQQYSKSGTLLQTQAINVGAFGIFNPYGGEIAFSAVSGAVPEPSSWALLIAGFGLTGAAMRRRRVAMA